MSQADNDKTAMLIDFMSRGKRAQEAADRIIDTWTRPCPFMGCATQTVLPCEVEAEQPNGSVETESWFAVACACGASGRAGRTEREARENWNRRT